jgi:hypothetical protein
MKDEAMQILQVLSVVQQKGKEMRKYFLALDNIIIHLLYFGEYRYTFAIPEYKGEFCI